MSISKYDPEVSDLTSKIIGQKIKDIRMMTNKEMDHYGWDGEKSAVIVLENGITLFASCDYEGNSAGAIFGKHNKIDFILFVD